MRLKEWCDSNWYYLKDSLEWINIDRYWDWCVSVTTILKLIVDPKFDYVLQNNKEAVELAASKWTEEHYKAEKFFEKWSWVTDMNLNFTKFHSLYNVDIISTEQTLYKDIYIKNLDKENLSDKYTIRWTIDCIGYYEDYPYSKWIANIDYKNSDKHSAKYLMQLAGYKWLNWNNWMLVYGKWKLKVVPYNWELDSLWIELLEYFISLLNNNE